MIHCLHGFLGSPRDWDQFGDFGTGQGVVKADLFGADAFPGARAMAAWADTYFAEHVGTGPNYTGPNYLLGYSLGGRLALHLATQYPNAWDGIVIIGANPGLDDAGARAARRAHDEMWARRFETQPWDTLLAAWDAQAVFGGRPGGERQEADFDRARLADALRRWSLGAQEPLWAALTALPCPLLWVAGAEDVKQQSICCRVSDTVPGAQVGVAPDAAHRVPWEQPEAFAARVHSFLTQPEIGEQL